MQVHRLPVIDSAPAEASSTAGGAPSEGKAEVAPHVADAHEPEVLLQVGELARETGKTVRALHLYEELGLLAPHARSKGRFRLYGREALVRVRWISKLQDMGLSLAEITQLSQGWAASGSAPDAMDKVRQLFEAQLRQTREQIERLQTLESELTASLRYLDVCGAACNPVRVVSHCTACDLHGCDEPAPELVVGVHTGIPRPT